MLGDKISSDVFLSLFFFQAEDGIRDGRVTGVQTCALPISVLTLPQQRGVDQSENRGGRSDAESQRQYGHHRERFLFGKLPDRVYDIALAVIQQIGRASCRERV